MYTDIQNWYTRNRIRIDIRALGLPHQRPIYLAKKNDSRTAHVATQKTSPEWSSLWIHSPGIDVGWLAGNIIVEFQVSMQKQSSIWIKTLLWVPKYPKTMQFSDPWERLPRFFASFTEPDNTIISGYNMYLYDIYIYTYIYIYIYIYISPKNCHFPKASDIWKGCNYSWKLKLVVWSGKSTWKKPG